MPAPIEPSRPTVTLTPWELTDAAHIGIRRHIRNANTRNRHNLDPTDEEWHYDILGAIGECVLAKYTGKYWTGAGLAGPDKGDVGKNLRVRTTRPGCRLIVYKTDEDDAVFVLITGTLLQWTVEGWLHGWEAKQDIWWDIRRREPAYFVEREALHPITKLAL